MKKIFTLLLVALMVWAMPVVGFATDTTVQEDVGYGEDRYLPDTDADGNVIETTVADTTAADTTVEDTTMVEDTTGPIADTTGPVEDENPDTSTTGPEELTPEEKEEIELTTGKIVQYVQDHLEEISVIITLILTVFYQMRKHGLLNKSIGTLNNNAVTIAENSSASINKTLAGMESVSAVVAQYKDEMASLLTEVRANAEEKRMLERVMADTQSYLKTAKLANLELSNEVAELLVLANIPNSKKEELYSRHLAAVNALSAAEAEVTNHVGEEA